MDKQMLKQIYQALETIKVSGMNDCATLFNCFKALQQLIEEGDENERIQ